MPDRVLFNDKMYYSTKGHAVFTLVPLHPLPDKQFGIQVIRLEDMIFDSLVAAGRIVVFTRLEQ